MKLYYLPVRLTVPAVVMGQFELVRVDGVPIHLLERVRWPSGARWVVRRRWRAPDTTWLH